MKLSDAKRILSGELYNSYPVSLRLKYDESEQGGKTINTYSIRVDLTKKDVDFMLRQLALKVTREKGK